ncbi:hypothetical protein JM79_0520 [Gramella sp. Hel_I_59]|uniref:hypothetical protein n=1 Tax=Gramella sp. Hel_I_59 TaxID=1249978 RepID=UPI001153936F|nr:hypothetical protein [Gramella sp. Hel_I_59]TQI69638.1 hypothetical protein JM79_0520 [Gramella sp. Hel_I_59]
MIDFRNPHHIEPPGALRQILEHPFNKSESIELALFPEHRYAFFYWNKWMRKNERDNPPCLVSLDWHQDLCYTCETEKEWLEALDLSSDADVSVFSWAKLAGNNDGHILCAAHLNLIGDIYVHCRQEMGRDTWEDEVLQDSYGNKHTIKKFKTYQSLQDALLNSTETSVFFGIDLDFFSVKNGLSDGSFKFTYLKDDAIRTMLDKNNPLIKWIFERIKGFTIAIEPEHCGGLLKSNKFLDLISDIYFSPELFAPKSNWKWKPRY